MNQRDNEAQHSATPASTLPPCHPTSCSSNNPSSSFNSSNNQASFSFPPHVALQPHRVLSPARASTPSSYNTPSQQTWTAPRSNLPRGIYVTLKGMTGMMKRLDSSGEDQVVDDSHYQLLVGFGNVSLKRSIHSFGGGTETKVTFPYRNEEFVRFQLLDPNGEIIGETQLPLIPLLSSRLLEHSQAFELAPSSRKLDVVIGLVFQDTSQISIETTRNATPPPSSAPQYPSPTRLTSWSFKPQSSSSMECPSSPVSRTPSPDPSMALWNPTSTPRSTSPSPIQTPSSSTITHPSSPTSYRHEQPSYRHEQPSYRHEQPITSAPFFTVDPVVRHKSLPDRRPMTSTSPDIVPGLSLPYETERHFDDNDEDIENQETVRAQYLSFDPSGGSEQFVCSPVEELPSIQHEAPRVTHQIASREHPQDLELIIKAAGGIAGSNDEKYFCEVCRGRTGSVLGRTTTIGVDNKGIEQLCEWNETFSFPVDPQDSALRLDLFTATRTPVASGVLRPFPAATFFEQEVVLSRATSDFGWVTMTLAYLFHAASVSPSTDRPIPLPPTSSTLSSTDETLPGFLPARRSFGSQRRGSGRRRQIGRIRRLRKSSHPYQTSDLSNRQDSLVSSLSSFSSSASDSDDRNDWVPAPRLPDESHEEKAWLALRQSVLSASLSQPILVFTGETHVPARCLLVHLLQGKASLGPFRVPRLSCSVHVGRQSAMRSTINGPEKEGKWNDLIVMPFNKERFVKFVIANHHEGHSRVVGDSDLDLSDFAISVTKGSHKLKKKLEVLDDSHQRVGCLKVRLSFRRIFCTHARVLPGIFELPSDSELESVFLSKTSVHESPRSLSLASPMETIKPPDDAQQAVALSTTLPSPSPFSVIRLDSLTVDNIRCIEALSDSSNVYLTVELPTRQPSLEDPHEQRSFCKCHATGPGRGSKSLVFGFSPIYLDYNGESYLRFALYWETIGKPAALLAKTRWDIRSSVRDNSERCLKTLTMCDRRNARTAERLTVCLRLNLSTAASASPSFASIQSTEPLPEADVQNQTLYSKEAPEEECPNSKPSSVLTLSLSEDLDNSLRWSPSKTSTQEAMEARSSAALLEGNSQFSEELDRIEKEQSSGKQESEIVSESKKLEEKDLVNGERDSCINGDVCTNDGVEEHMNVQSEVDVYRDRMERSGDDEKVVAIEDVREEESRELEEGNVDDDIEKKDEHSNSEVVGLIEGNASTAREDDSNADESKEEEAIPEAIGNDIVAETKEEKVLGQTEEREEDCEIDHLGIESVNECVVKDTDSMEESLKDVIPLELIDPLPITADSKESVDTINNEENNPTVNSPSDSAMSYTNSPTTRSHMISTFYATSATSPDLPPLPSPRFDVPPSSYPLARRLLSDASDMSSVMGWIPSPDLQFTGMSIKLGRARVLFEPRGKGKMCCYCQASLGTGGSMRSVISAVVVNSTTSPEFDEDLFLDYNGEETELKIEIIRKRFSKSKSDEIIGVGTVDLIPALRCHPLRCKQAVQLMQPSFGCRGTIIGEMAVTLSLVEDTAMYEDDDDDDYCEEDNQVLLLTPEPLSNREGLSPYRNSSMEGKNFDEMNRLMSIKESFDSKDEDREEMKDDRGVEEILMERVVDDEKVVIVGMGCEEVGEKGDEVVGEDQRLSEDDEQGQNIDDEVVNDDGNKGEVRDDLDCEGLIAEEHTDLDEAISPVNRSITFQSSITFQPSLQEEKWVELPKRILLSVEGVRDVPPPKSLLGINKAWNPIVSVQYNNSQWQPIPSINTKTSLEIELDQQCPSSLSPSSSPKDLESSLLTFAVSNAGPINLLPLKKRNRVVIATAQISAKLLNDHTTLQLLNNEGQFHGWLDVQCHFIW